MKRLTIYLILVLFPIHLFSAFNMSDFAARSSSMGDAFTSVADDGSAPFYNPAGIVQLEKKEFFSTYSFIYPGLDINSINQMHLSFILPVKKKSAVGLSFVNLGLQDIYSEQIIQLSFARKLNSLWYHISKNLRKNEFYIGGNVKLLRQSFIVDDTMKQDPLFAGNKDSSNGLTFDFGLMVKIFDRATGKFYNIGLAVFNLTQPDIGLKTEEIIPLTFRLGFSTELKRFDFMKKISMDSPMFSLDMDYRNKDFNLHFGWENSFINELLFFRLGSTLLDFSTGLGFKYSIGNKYDILLDYGFILPYKIDGTSGKHLISLKFRF